MSYDCNLIIPPLQDNHNETMGKLSFVNDLVSCVMELAQSRGGPLHSLAESVSLHQVL